MPSWPSMGSFGQGGGPDVEGHPWRGNDQDAPRQFGDAAASYGSFGAGNFSSNSGGGGSFGGSRAAAVRDRTSRFQSGRK